MNLIKALVLLIVAGIVCAAAFVYFGVFNAAADVPHWPLTYQLMETTRQRSIAVRAKDVQVTSLDDPQLIAQASMITLQKANLTIITPMRAPAMSTRIRTLRRKRRCRWKD